MKKRRKRRWNHPNKRGYHQQILRWEALPPGTGIIRFISEASYDHSRLKVENSNLIIVFSHMYDQITGQFVYQNLKANILSTKSFSHLSPLCSSICINVHHNVLYIFSLLLTRRNCLIIRIFFSWWSFLLFLWL